MTAIKFFGFNLKKIDEALLNKYLILDDLITGIILFVYLQLLEHTIAAAPFFIATFINFSPFNLLPYRAKKTKPFRTLLLFDVKPFIVIFLVFFKFLINFLSNIVVVKFFAIYG